MSEIIYANDQNLKELISEGKVLVDFYADWCSPCRMLGPVLEQLAEENSDIKIIKVNVEDNPVMTEEFGISGIPAMKTFVDGELQEEFSGFRPKPALQEILDNL